VDLEPGHLTYSLRRQSRGNILMAGMETGSAAMTLLAMLASFALRLPRRMGRIRLLNLLNVDDPAWDAFEPLRGLPIDVEIGGHDDIDAFVAASHAATLERVEANRAGARGGPPTPPEVLAVFGLQGARPLHRGGSYGKASESATQLKKVLSQGPGQGIHVVCWTDSWNNFGRVFEIADLDEFAGRIVFRGGDSHKALGSLPGVPSFRRNSALLFDEQWEEGIRKFRCYGAPLNAAGSWDGERLSWLWQGLAALPA
jgi:hypothetical protein